MSSSTSPPLRPAAVALLLLGALGPTSGCGGAAQQQQVYGEEEVVESSRKERPEWLGRISCPQDRVCAQGSRERAAVLEHAQTDAYKTAVKQFANRLQEQIETSWGQAREEDRPANPGEDPDVLLNIKEFAATASKISVENVHIDDFWWKKVRSLGEDRRYHYGYDYHVLVSIPKATWAEKVRRLFEEKKEAARSAKQEKLEQKLDDVMNKVLEEKP